MIVYLYRYGACGEEDVRYVRPLRFLGLSVCLVFPHFLALGAWLFVLGQSSFRSWVKLVGDTKARM